MRPYQEEYLANLRQFAALSHRELPGTLSFDEYAARLQHRSAETARLGRRNIELLREGLFPTLDDLFNAGPDQLADLREFSFQLFGGQTELDVGLFCQIHRALLSLARQKQDRAAMIRELYWLGMGRNSLCSKLVGLELEDIEKYINQMRLCFTEAAAYLKYYDEIEDDETRGYILRARANIALGQFHTPSEKIQLVKGTLQILQDKHYQELSPGLPWDRFIYLTHQNMASSISYEKSRVMSPQDMEAIMESVYIVYHRQIQEAREQHKRPPVRSAFNYSVIEYYCGIISLDQLLRRTEDLLDAADPADFSPEGMYAIASLPAFYSQYLQQFPDRVSSRKEYLDQLYLRILRYVDTCPRELGEGRLFLYLRQLSFTYVETDSGIPYGELLQKLMLRFATEVYLHSLVVAEGARTLCGIILEDDPGFFDDIDFIRAIGDPEEKRRAVLDFAGGCGLFHDAGKISVIELFSLTARQWFEVEYEMARLHTLAGEALLASRPSTSRYAAAALGHHAWYDGSRGYPSAYRRLECPARQMVDVIALVDWLEASTSPTQMYNGPEQTLEEAVQTAVQLEGRRFSPLLTARLQDGRVVEQLRLAFEAGRQDAYRQIYEDGLQAAPSPG